MKMVFATPEGDYHDIGLMIAAKMAGLAGHETLFLGANAGKTAVGHSIYLERPHKIFSSLEEFEAAVND